jgi:hypothetical protein
VAVLRDLARGDVVNALGLLEALGHVGDRRLELLIARLKRLRLDEDLLARLLGEGVIQDLPGLA